MGQCQFLRGYGKLIMIDNGTGTGTGQISRAGSGTHEFQTYQKTTDWIHSPSKLTKNE